MGGGAGATSLGWGARVGYSLLYLPESQALMSLPILRFPCSPLLCKRPSPAPHMHNRAACRRTFLSLITSLRKKC